MSESTVPRTSPELPHIGANVIDDSGRPTPGAFAGAVGTVDWSPLAAPYGLNPVNRFLRHKKWVYAVAATDDLVLALAVVDAGPTGTAFVMLTDLNTGDVVADSSRPGSGPLVRVGPHSGEGLSAQYRLPGTNYRLRWDEGSDQVRITVSLTSTAGALPGLHSIPGLSRVPGLSALPSGKQQPWLEVDLSLETTDAEAITAISRVEQDHPMATSTVKTSALPAWGTVTVHGPDGPSFHSLDGGLGGYDYTNGFLPRHTSWRWAYGITRLEDGRRLGLNLVSGFSGIGDHTAENALWLDGRLLPLDPAARIEFTEGAHDQPWTIRTLDEAVNLRFIPVASHKEGLNLGVVRSHFLQPSGWFEGTIAVDGERLDVRRMPGVVEDQDILW